MPGLLNPHSTVSIMYYDAYDYVSPSKIRITWVNENAEQGTYENEL